RLRAGPVGRSEGRGAEVPGRRENSAPGRLRFSEPGRATVEGCPVHAIPGAAAAPLQEVELVVDDALQASSLPRRLLGGRGAAGPGLCDGQDLARPTGRGRPAHGADTLAEPR